MLESYGKFIILPCKYKTGRLGIINPATASWEGNYPLMIVGHASSVTYFKRDLHLFQTKPTSALNSSINASISGTCF